MLAPHGSRAFVSSPSSLPSTLHLLFAISSPHIHSTLCAPRHNCSSRPLRASSCSPPGQPPGACSVTAPLLFSHLATFSPRQLYGLRGFFQARKAWSQLLHGRTTTPILLAVGTLPHGTGSTLRITRRTRAR